MISDYRYVQRIDFHRLPHGGDSLLILSNDYTVRFRIDGNVVEYTVPAGFKTDGPSVPYWVPKWVAQTGLSPALEAAVVHDHMCVEKPYTSVIAAEIFREGLKAAGYGWMKRNYMHKAVRYGGPKWG